MRANGGRRRCSAREHCTGAPIPNGTQAWPRGLISVHILHESGTYGASTLFRPASKVFARHFLPRPCGKREVYVQVHYAPLFFFSAPLVPRERAGKYGTVLPGCESERMALYFLTVKKRSLQIVLSELPPGNIRLISHFSAGDFLFR